MTAFISYSHLDRPVAKRFAGILDEFGLAHWWDDRIALSSRWNDELEQRMASATSVVVLWTPNSVDSDWVCHEAAIGLAASKLLQFRMMNAQLPEEFAHLQAADVPVWEAGTYPRGIRRGLNAIAGLQSKPPVLDEHPRVRLLKLSDNKVMRFIDEGKHREGYFPKLDNTLFKDIWEMQMDGQIKLYDELRGGSRLHMSEERYYELIEYLSEPLQGKEA